MPLLTQYFLPNHPGLGDHIRGSILLKKLADNYGYTYQPNFLCSVIKDYIDLEGTSKVNILPNNLEKFYVHETGANLSLHILHRTLEKRQDVNIVSNVGYISTPNHNLILDKESKTFIKNLLKPSTTLLDKINKFAVENLIKDKIIYHVRLFDSMESVSDDFIQFIHSKLTHLDGNLLFSNNEDVKRKLCSVKSPIIATNNAAHFGNLKCKSSVESNMLEYFLIGMVKRIVTFSMYDWTSNFISSKAAAHDIPVISNCIVQNMKNKWVIQNNNPNIVKCIQNHRIFI